MITFDIGTLIVVAAIFELGFMAGGLAFERFGRRAMIWACISFTVFFLSAVAYCIVKAIHLL
jgi:hypothetical protein